MKLDGFSNEGFGFRHGGTGRNTARQVRNIGGVIRRSFLNHDRVTHLGHHSLSRREDSAVIRRFQMINRSQEVRFGGPCRGRTYGPLIKSQLLYQLS